MADIPLNILLSSVGGAGVISAVKSIGSALGSGGLGGALLAVGAAAAVAAVGVAVASEKMAANFQQSMDKIQALTGSSNQQMQQYNASLNTLAVNAGVAPQALSEGLYNVISAGYSGASAINELTLATQDSKIGMTDAATTTTALTNVMANFKVSASGANLVNGEMLETVTLGKATFSQYANNITKAASTSVQYGQSMETMGAAWATLTAAGIPAGVATTDYDQSLKVMDGSIGKVVTSLQKNGIAFNETKFNAMSYGQQVVYMNNALQQARDKHVAITGATAQASAAISTIAGHISTYNSDLGKLSDKQAMADKTQQAWTITQSGANQQMSRLNAAGQVLLITIGNQLLPIFSNVVSQITPIVSSFTTWITTSGVLKTVIGDLVGAITTIVTIGANIISFFLHSQVVTAALGVAVGILGGIMAYFAASTAADMILSLLEYGLSMLTAVEGTLTGAATMTSTFGTMSGMIVASMGTATASIMTIVGPFLLIGAGIAIVVVGFVLAYNNIKPFHDAVNNLAQLISSTFLSALHSVSGFIQNVVTDIKNIVEKIVEWNQKTQPLHAVLNGVGTAVNGVKGFIQGAIGVISSVIGWFEKWHTPIMNTALALTVFFAPALIKAGVQAVINGAKVTANFIGSMITSGAQAIANGAKVTVSFIGSMIASGTQAIANGAKVTVSFIGSMIASGTQAVINGAKVTVSFIGSMIAAGMQGWASAGKMVMFIGSMIASGTQAVINGAKVTVSFIGSMIASGAQAITQGAIVTASFIGSMVQAGLKAVIAGAQIVASFVGSLITTAGQAIVTGATMVASLVPAIVSVVVEAGIAAVTAIPGLILGFAAWAVSAGAAALATLAAAAPILLIIAVVALLVVGIYLLVTHWKQVVAFLQGAWQGFVSWITPAVRKVGQVFTDVFNGVKSFLQNAWAFIVNVAKGAALLLLAVILGPIGLIVVLIIQHWTQIRTFLETAMNAIVSVVRTGWNNLTSNITDAINFIKNIVTTLWNDEINGWNNILSIIRGIVTNLWNGVVTLFNNAKSNISSAVSNIWNGITGIMNSWPGLALQAGAKIVNSIADGIRGAIGNVTSAIGSVTSAIGNFLPHSPAKQGELSHLNEYGPNLVRGFSTGIIQSLPLMANAMGMLTKPLGSVLSSVGTTPTSAGAVGTPSSIVASSLSGTGSNGVGNAGATTAAPQITQTIQLTLNLTAQKIDESEMEQIAKYTVTYFGDQIRSQFGSIAV